MKLRKKDEKWSEGEAIWTSVNGKGIQSAYHYTIEHYDGAYELTLYLLTLFSYF